MTDKEKIDCLQDAMEEMIAEILWFVSRKKNLSEYTRTGETWASVLDSDLEIGRKALKTISE